MADALPTVALQALQWQAYGSDVSNLVCPILLDFTTYSQYTFNPQGIFRQAGTVYADGLVVDNLLNSGPLTVMIGPIVETVPPYTKTTFQLGGTSAQITVKGVQARLFVTFFRGTYLGTTSGTNYYAAQIAAGLAVETGFISMFAGSSAAIPVGYLLCDGTPISRTTYAGLFSVIGTLYGGGDGSTTFNLPNMVGRAAVGAGSTAGLSTRALASTGGAESVTLSTAQMPPHTHGLTDPGHAHGVTDPGHTHGINDPQHAHTVYDTGHTHTLNDPGHGHGITDNGHAHVLTDPGHGHGLTDNGHAHGITDSGHNHGVTDNGHVHNFQALDSGGNVAGRPSTLIMEAGGAANTWTGPNNGNWFFNGKPNQWDGAAYWSISINSGVTGVSNVSSTANVSVNKATTGLSLATSTTNVTVNGATTGIALATSKTSMTMAAAATGVIVQIAPTNITVVAKATGVSVQSGTTGITMSSAGGSNGVAQSVPTMPPYVGINFVIKT